MHRKKPTLELTHTIYRPDGTRYKHQEEYTAKAGETYAFSNERQPLVLGNLNWTLNAPPYRVFKQPQKAQTVRPNLAGPKQSLQPLSAGPGPTGDEGFSSTESPINCAASVAIKTRNP